MRSCIYTGYLTHRRTAPVAHHFRYRVAIFYLDLDELEELSRSLRVFGFNRGKLVSFQDRDHMNGQPGATKQKVLAFLRTHGIDLSGGTIRLLTQCRVFNYVFNPVSFYYCHTAAGDCRCVVAEVNNTFGERHLYLLDEGTQLASSASGRVSYVTPKVMHVSPFVSMDACYEFHFAPVADRLSVSMKESEHGRHFFDAHLWGVRRALSDRSLAGVLLRYPWLTLKIIGAIHWQALCLYLKGAPVYHQPAPSVAQRDQLRLLQRIG